MPIQAYLCEQLLVECAELGRALGNSHRVNIIQHLVQKEFSVDSLAKLLKLSIANASQHLQHLKRVGIVESRREGKLIYYRLSNKPVISIFFSLKQQVDYARKEFRELVNQEKILDDENCYISHYELIDALRTQSIMLIDVRSIEEFNNVHLPGAVNVPFETFEYYLALLPKNKEIIVYCRGAECFLSKHIMINLRLKGFKVRQYKEGISAIKLFQ
ncbi:metalloregulator ArsR/SmtB family transcription factor [Providencia sneebia]|uniref:Transcriptional regulator n=1 Tax=Providencia sneebia DSM 19967 TaxID=1141660 RepID=K8WK46_9GAMM|nr:metalloregulator ArsR/SmtB family transcription factor [Providencia sneebia]EKT60904.1 transcriptional regulator [Providencia sneebia DSM 19967]